MNFNNSNRQIIKYKIYYIINNQKQMGRKERQQRSQSNNRKGNSNISKQNNNFGQKRNGKPQHGRQDRRVQNQYQRPGRQARQGKQGRQGKQVRQQSAPKHRNTKKGKGGQYSQYIGKSMFKIVQQGKEDDQKDQFAALNNGQEDIQENYQQVEGDQNEYDEQEQNAENMEDQQELQVDQQNQQYPAEEDQNQFEGDVEGQQNQGQGQDQYQYEEQGEQGEQGEGQQQQVVDQDGVKNEEQGGQEGQYQMDEQQDQNVDINVINLRIQQTLQVLMNLPKLGQGKSRKHFVDKLKAYIHRYYGYNYQLIDHFLNFMNPNQMIQFFEANQTQRPLTIRTNTLKTRRKQLAQFLIQRGVNLDPLAEWSKVGIKIYDTKVPIGATPEYLAGYYMLQSASSFLPVLALDPQMNQKILDMASAPGGKTSYIAQIMKNTGSIFANDLKKDRLKALQFNIWRLGITNTVVTCRDGRKYPQIFPNTFDRVLLDAPCTGLGIISKDHSIKANRVLIDIYKNSHVQKQLLLAAIDCTKVGGIVVYSTCSVSPLENQQVINYALKKRHVKIVDIDDLVEVGDAGLTKFIDKRYHVDLRKTKRIYPHVHNMDGFYLGKLVKTANGKKQSPKEEGEDKQQ